MKAPIAAVVSVVLLISSPVLADLTRGQLKLIQGYTKTLEKSRKVHERKDAAYELGRFEEAPEVVAPLTRALGDREADVRRQAADSLWRVGEVAAPAEQALRQVLGDPSPGVRVRAAAALEALGMPEEELVEARIAGLRAERLRDRILAARDLVGFVSGARLVVPIAEVAAAEADTASYDMGGRFLDPVKVLERLVRSGDRDFAAPMLAEVEAGNPGRRWLVKGMADLEPKPEGWNHALISMLDSPRDEDVDVAMTLLSARTTEDEGVREWILPVMVLLDDSPVAWRAAATLKPAGGHAAAAAPKLAELLRSSPDAEVREEAAEALAAIGNRDQAFPSEFLREVAVISLPALTRAAIEDPEEDVRGESLAALHVLRVSAAEVLDTFVVAAKTDADDSNRFKTLQYIRDLGTDGQAAIPHLEEIIKNDPSNKGMAEQALYNVQNSPPDFSLDVATGPAEPGTDDALRQLRDAGVDFTMHTYNRAIADVEVDKVRLFLAAGMSANDPVDDVGMRPLHNLYFGSAGCALHERPTPEATKELTRMLLEAGADANAKDDRSNSVLKFAAMACDAEVVQMLLDAGADMYATDFSGMTAFELTLFSGTDAADPLLEAGFRMPADRANQLREAYKDNPRAQELLKRATAN